MSTRTEDSLRPRSVILICQNPLPSLHYTCTYFRGRVALVECLLGQKHVTVWSTGLGAVFLFQDQYPVPYIAVYKVNLEVGAIFARPLHTSTGNLTNLDAFGGYTLYRWGSDGVGVFSQWGSLPLPYWVCWCAANNLAARSATHTGHCIQSIYCAMYDGPSLVIWCLYAASK